MPEVEEWFNTWILLNLWNNIYELNEKIGMVFLSRKAENLFELYVISAYGKEFWQTTFRTW